MDDGLEEESSASSKFKDNLIELIQFGAIVLAILVIVRFFVAEPHKVSGSSMFPNFHDGDFIITYKLSAHYGNLERGEVIILQDPNNNSQDFIKRIVGFPGDRIKISGGKVYLNGQILNEPYLPVGTMTTGESFLRDNEEIVVPDGQYFVLGDNRPHSSDSREFGPIKKELIIGQAWLRYWPPQRATLPKIGEPSVQPD